MQASGNILGTRLPTRCALCGDAGEPGILLCAPCWLELPWNHHACESCAHPLTTADARLCARCLQQSPPFDGSWAPLIYAEPVDSLITALKFDGRLAYANLLGAILALPTPPKTVDRLVPVPLHRRRRRT